MIMFTAKKENGAIWIYFGKWRPICFHKYGKSLPGKKFLIERVFPIIRQNMGGIPESEHICLDWK